MDLSRLKQFLVIVTLGVEKATNWSLAPAVEKRLKEPPRTRRRRFF
jgi:hypothetical protein